MTESEQVEAISANMERTRVDLGLAPPKTTEHRGCCDAAEGTNDRPPKWTQAQAIELCRKIEAFAPRYGCHVALTGGTLYHFGERKDADILFYRIRQVEEIDVDGLMAALTGIGVTPGNDHGWCFKATYQSRAIDFFFPERPGSEYPGRNPAPSLVPALKDEVEPF